MRVYDGRFTHVVGCWQTLTEFVRLAAKFGIGVNLKDDEIWANEGSPQ